MWGYGQNSGMMNGYGGYGYGYGYGVVHMIIWVVILIAVIAAVVWLVRSIATPGLHHLPPNRSTGLEFLEERYARGEINREEYLQKKKDIGG